MDPLEKPTVANSLTTKKFIGEILVELNWATKSEIEDALVRANAQKVRIGELLVSEKKISDTQLARAIALQYSVEYIALDPKMEISADVMKLMPEKTMRFNLVLPLMVHSGSLRIAVYDPVQFVKLDSFRKAVGMPCVLSVATKAQLEATFDRIFKKTGSVEEIVEHLAKRELAKRPLNTASKSSVTSLRTKVDEPSVEGLVNKIIDRAIEDGASDIHIDPSASRVRVRFRLDGILHEIHTYPIEMHSTVTSRLKVLSELDISEKRNPQDGRFHYAQGERPVDIRVSTLPTVRGEKVVLRILDGEKLRGTLEEIGLSGESASQVQGLLQKPYGIIFITGPTGSGKTTTLYTMLAQINGEEKNILTVEDPVEIKFDVVNQVQVNEKAGLTFSNVLRNILRQDPDVLMIGEVRDRETADIAIRSALTGHLVLSTLHTNDSASTPNRLVDMGIEPYLLSSALLAVISQRLVRILCLGCRARGTITEEDRSVFAGREIPADTIVYSPVGCEKCHFTGYKGRIPIFEILIIDDVIRKLIIERRPEIEITAHLESKGFVSMRDDGVHKVVAGITSVDEILKSTL